MSRLALFLGGSRSGKSELAEKSALDYERVAYIATCPVVDEELAARVRAHRERRPAHWRTIEEPLRVADALEKAAREFPCVLIDSLTLWVSNLLFAPEFQDADDDRLLDEVREFCLAAAACDADVLVVSDEVGCGVVPDNALSRRFRDLLGWANQILATEANEVYWVAAGLAQRLK